MASKQESNCQQYWKNTFESNSSNYCPVEDSDVDDMDTVSIVSQSDDDTSSPPTAEERKHENVRTSWTIRTKHQLPAYDVAEFKYLKSGYFDTHCHLDFLFQRERFRGTFASYMVKNHNDFHQCYEACIAVFCDPLTIEKKWLWENLLKEDGIWAAFGCHPHHAKDFDAITENVLREALRHPHVVALGEIGLDYSRKTHNAETQKVIFRKLLKIAIEMNLPIVLHCRDADQDCLCILKEEVPTNYRIHHHCFTGGWKDAKLWLNAFPNLFIGITGLVTYPSAKEVQEVVRRIPLNRLLLETEAPYFVPKHKTLQGRKSSNPGMAIYVAAHIAALRYDVTLEELLRKIRNNIRQLYGC